MRARSPGPIALAVPPTSPPERVGEAFARGALELARRPRGSVLLAEERQGAPGWELRLVGEEGLLELFARAFAEAGVRLDPVPNGPSHLPTPEAGNGEFGVVEPVAPAPAEAAARRDRVPVRTEPIDRSEAETLPAAPALAGPRPSASGLWFALQSHVVPDGKGSLDLWVRLCAHRREGTGSPVEAAAPELTARGSLLGLAVGAVTALGVRRRLAREWRTGAVHGFRSARPFPVDPALAGRLLAAGVPGPEPAAAELGHTICFGASGSGKSAFLADLARQRVRAGAPSVVLDLHGTLGPELIAGLDASERERIVAIDPSAPGPAVGLPLLRGGSPAEAELERAQLLAALRRLGARDGEVYWGFRIDRVLESFLALAQEGGGDLRELAALLTDPHRRELARARTGSPALAAFLEELPALLRRNPEFLWPATARLGRLLLSPRLLACVAPRGPGIEPLALFASGRSLLLRLPIGELGPESAELLATLLVTRVFLDLARRGTEGGRAGPGVLLLADEAHRLSPYLLTEILGEGRKFGLGVVAATQYPERLDPQARAAAAGAANRHLLFRLPRSLAREAGRWAGLPPELAERLLPTLPPGSAVEAVVGPRAPRRLVRVAPPRCPDRAGWNALVERSAREFGAEEAEEEPCPEPELRLALLRLDGPGALPATGDLDDSEERARRELLRRRWAERAPAGWSLTPEGARAASTLARTGAVRESETHRALLLASARILARKGALLELPRQGGFDRPVPDGLLRQLGPGPTVGPTALALAVDRARAGWAWHAFHGRDVFVEAEVSGALRPERIRHGLSKARRQGAFVLFIVPDAGRARRVRAVLVRCGAGREEASVWTLRVPAPPTEG
ncbi:MAG TPA: hypothetical protein VGU43_00380 [Thermoplasmata archaeon]|nr:hypothetical protein [Thermoplasmata archaeon]